MCGFWAWAGAGVSGGWAFAREGVRVDSEAEGHEFFLKVFDFEG